MSSNHSPFSIRPIKATGDRKPKSLGEFIARVNITHPGGFRALNQAEVRRQIEEKDRKQHGDPDTPDVHMEDGAGSEDEADPEASSDLGAARMKILQNISFAWRQANNAQQLVSLLMSKEAPTQVMGTLDPELRNMVGIGSLGSTKLHEPPFWEQRLQDNTVVSTGAKLLAINNSANKLLAAATRLQKEMTVETEYWHEVLNIKEGGWPVSRLPNNPLTVAVKFGFSDSSPEFQANSWAALNREDDGSVNLRMPPLVAEPKQLVVSMEKDGKNVGRSSLTQPLPTNAPLELRVREARNTVLAQELWHELNREARSLLSYDVQLLPGSIRYQVDDSTALVFSLHTLGEVPELGAEPEVQTGDGRVETVYASLYLLLAHAHRQNARKRTQGQVLTINRGSQQKPAYSLLKPIVAFIQHETWLRSSISYLSELTATLHLAGIDAAHFNLEEQPLPQISPQGASEQLVNALLLQPFVFRIDLTLTPQVRMTMVGITGTGPRGPSSHIRFMPPSAKQDAQALAKGHGPNLLGVIYQPADVYESLRDAFQYLQGATTRALAKQFEILAAKWMANAPPAESTPTVWATTIKGDAVRDVDTERRGVSFELLGAGEERPANGQSAILALPKVTGLKLSADQVDLQGGIVHQVFSWHLDDIARDDAGPKEQVEDVVQRVLMTAA